MNFDGSQVNYLIAFLGGLVTFFASCLLPLVPTYLAYLSGVAIEKEQVSRNLRGQVFFHSLSFVIGFILVFALLGASATFIGLLFSQYKSILQKLGGMFLILLGLSMAGWLRPKWYFVERRFDTKNILAFQSGFLRSFLFGLTFGLAWTPCIG